MGWEWRKEHLDIMLVPIGLLIMLGYHLFLLYRCLKFPHTTVIGYENHSKRAWIDKTMQVDAKDRGMALSVISNHMSAASNMSSISLVLSSLIGAWIGNTSDSNIFTNRLIYGDTSASIISIKYMALLTCFLVAFASFVQSTKSFVHANFLISMPNTDIPVAYIENALIRGSNFWTVGLRALYFAATLIMWIFGPIPMFVCSVIMVALLHTLDRNSLPLHDFQPPSSRNLFKKIGEEITTMTRAFEHHERPNGNESRPTAAVNEQNRQLQQLALNNQNQQQQQLSNSGVAINNQNLQQQQEVINSGAGINNQNLQQQQQVINSGAAINNQNLQPQQVSNSGIDPK
ncbi:hypothetical protein F0562_010368 [Nyssa sinensis]|uniref:Uncharacterized protein n=1 Tax=Nyssa sinensis TaxID=561372 RepID=A0A5J4ZYN9_9ASTE|nr:hypothetical protein F0562_010368 [Nyssa sinensis]